jgi:hypothetical protein
MGENIRDGEGKIIRSMTDVRGDGESFTAYSNGDKTGLHFFDISDNKFVCSDDQGVSVLIGQAPMSEVPKPAKQIDVPGYPSYIDDSENVSRPRGVWVRFRSDQPKYLAVVASFVGLPRAQMYIYEPNGVLVYHELLDEEAEDSRHPFVRRN